MSGPSKLWLAAAFFVFTLSVKIGLSQTKPGIGQPKAIRVMGCLVKGDEPGEVWLVDKEREDLRAGELENQPERASWRESDGDGPGFAGR